MPRHMTLKLPKKEQTNKNIARLLAYAVTSQSISKRSSLSKVLHQCLICPLRHFSSTKLLFFDYTSSRTAGTPDITCKRCIQLEKSRVIDVLKISANQSAPNFFRFLRIFRKRGGVLRRRFKCMTLKWYCLF